MYEKLLYPCIDTIFVIILHDSSLGKVLPADKIHPTMFQGADRKFKVIPWTKIERERRNKPKAPEKHDQIVRKLLSKEKKKREKLAKLGIDYEFAGYVSIG